MCCCLQQEEGEKKKPELSLLFAVGPKDGSHKNSSLTLRTPEEIYLYKLCVLSLSFPSHSLLVTGTSWYLFIADLNYG